jgi:hypothetical protein
MKNVVHEQPAEGGIGRYVFFFCPGCGNAHMVCFGVPGRPNWTSYNDDPVKPTIRASVLCRSEDRVCHSFVTNGRIEFLGDCTHKLAGQTVDLPPWDEPWGDASSPQP